jgi:hypothetical protein
MKQPGLRARNRCVARLPGFERRVVEHLRIGSGLEMNRLRRIGAGRIVVSQESRKNKGTRKDTEFYCRQSEGGHEAILNGGT